MNSNRLMTYAAAAFAGFALWYIARKPGNNATAQPAQAQRDAGLQTFIDNQSLQFDAISRMSYAVPLPSWTNNT